MARDYSYYFSQLRRIEDHREAKAEKEIRKLYKQILKETKQFIAEEYYQLAEDGKLTFDILRSKGQDARFLAEVEQRLGDLTQNVSKEIKQTVEEMYVMAYDGLKDAVQKSKDVEEFKELLQIADTSTAQMMWATVDNTLMDIALEKNHKDIAWNIKREIATSLMVGDRYETMAHRVADNLDRSYRKAILISRTEVGRVREAGHLASAQNLNEALMQGSSGLRMVKKWKSMRDGAVRDHHKSMHNKVVEMDEPFVLPDGVKTQAPKQSGVAKHDCNCRCTVLYPMMDDEEFFKTTGKHFSKTGESLSENESQYGVEYENLNVDVSYINSERYKEKFSTLTNNTDVNNAVHAISKDILMHRNGTEYEDMYLISATDGRIFAKITDSTTKHGVVYTDEFKEALSKNKENGIPIVGIHNHPQGTPPSPDDFRKAFENGYAFGVIPGHNGQVYRYETPTSEISKDVAATMDRNIGVFLLGGIDVDRAFRMVYNEMGLQYTILEGIDENG